MAAVEGIVKIKTGRLTPLSLQQLVDCVGTDQNDIDDDASIIDDAFKYIVKNKGLASEAHYPYRGIVGICDTEKAAEHRANIKGFVDVPPYNEELLQQAVANQPVSMAIAISDDGFQFYGGGIYEGPCGDSLNIAVTVIGYGCEDGTKFWLIKNSWGLTWGEDGYMKLLRDVENYGGHCGIAMHASYPTA